MTGGFPTKRLVLLRMLLCQSVNKILVITAKSQWARGVSNHQPLDCLLNRLFSGRSKKTSKLCVTGLCVGDSPVTGEFPAQMVSNAVNVFIGWRHHGILTTKINASILKLLYDDKETFLIIDTTKRASFSTNLFSMAKHSTEKSRAQVLTTYQVCLHMRPNN